MRRGREGKGGKSKYRMALSKRSVMLLPRTHLWVLLCREDGNLEDLGTLDELGASEDHLGEAIDRLTELVLLRLREE